MNINDQGMPRTGCYPHNQIRLSAQSGQAIRIIRSGYPHDQISQMIQFNKRNRYTFRVWCVYVCVCGGGGGEGGRGREGTVLLLHPSIKGSTLKGKNLLAKLLMSSLKEFPPLEKILSF